MPLDDGVGSGQQQITFKDKLLGMEEPLPRREQVDLIGKKLFHIKHGDRLKPKCYIEDNLLKEFRMPWKDAIFIKLLGKNIGFLTMRDRLRSVCKPVGGIDLVDIGHGFYLVKFDMEVDWEKVISGGPRMIFDHYLTV